MTNEQMIKEILLMAKLSGAYIGGELVFSLAFRTTQELKAICSELKIKTA